MRFSAVAYFLFYAAIVCGQSNYLKASYDVVDYTLSELLQTPNLVRLSDHSILRKVKPEEAIAELLQVDPVELQEQQSTQLTKQIVVKRYKRFINGIEVVHGNYSVLIKNGEITTIHAEHYNQPVKLKSKILTEKEALQFALKQLESNLYSWESTEKLLKSHAISSANKEKLKKVLKEDYPSGQLVYVRDYNENSSELKLAYLFIIESLSPEFRDKVFINAADGNILLRDPQLKHGRGDTRYSGRQTFPTTRIAIDTFELKGIEPISGIFCETRSLEGLGGTPVSTPAIIALSDPVRDGDETEDPCPTDMGEVRGEIPDDQWDKEEHRKVPFDGTLHTCCPVYIPGQCSEVRNDDLALDAHWGASIVARYWKVIHDRNGYDDQGASILSFVHHGEGYENASWNGLYMKYGDGAYQDGSNPGGMFSPLVSLDVCAHEIGHAICTSTSDLVYVGESGAMNEGFSDIWAACIEQYVLDSISISQSYLIWGIGEQIDERDGGAFNAPTARALRWMDHPPAENNPDTYGAGTWWQNPDCASPNVANDFCGVHFNSGVLNKWFYLLTAGSGNPYSPGAGKPAADDELNDKGHTYSVSGIGIRKAEKITYGAELLLMPNSRFADMRAASIDIARSLYGPCSNEVEQTIRAWYAVGVGPDFGTCQPTIAFNQFNVRRILESSEDVGCDAQKMVSLGVHSYMANTSVTFTTSGNAVEGVDYELCTTTLSFNGDETKEIDIIIFDDKVEEDDDTIIINFNGGGYTDSDTVVIVDDDGVPAIGSSAVLFMEDFSIDDGSWSQELVNPTSMINGWYIDPGNSNQAHISWDATPATPTYYQLIDSDIRLTSPLINAIGRQNVQVSFDHEAGGERDLVAPDALFDYGTFQLSFDGFSWTDITTFVGTADSGGQITEAGTYSMIHPELDNRSFYLGFAWHNDALNGGSFSFMIDNIMVTGEGLEIETDSNAVMSTNVPADERIAFISQQNEVIAIVENATSSLGCTELLIAEINATDDMVPSICYSRGSKVFNLIDESDADSVTLTLFFTEPEIDEWTDPTLLNILAISNTDIDEDRDGYVIIDQSAILVNDVRDNGNGYISYTFTTSSQYQSFALTDRPSTPQTNIVMTSDDFGTTSFRGIIEDACPEDTIRFGPATIADTLFIPSCDITVNKDLIIIGNDLPETILSGDGLHNLFIVPDHIELKIESILFVDHKDFTGSGTPCYEGSLILRDFEYRTSN